VTGGSSRFAYLQIKAQPSRNRDLVARRGKAAVDAAISPTSSGFARPANNRLALCSV
jgi:hypothetical protein